jgi:hypothetical protein
MNKFKNWLRYKLIKFLRIDTLTNLFDKHIDNNDNSFRELNNLAYSLNNNTRKELKNDISYCQQGVNTLHNTVENVVHIGTDVYRQPDQGHSWAVVCVEGKMNIVKFVDLDRKDGRYILDFLKQFEAGRHCVDAPFKEFFYDGLFKF